MDTRILNLLLPLVLSYISHTVRGDCPSPCLCRTGRDNRIQAVECRGHALRELPSKSLPPSALTMDFSGNNLDSITPATFFHSKQVMHLNLSRNEVGLVEGGSFADLTQIETLDLSWNKLEKIQQGVFQGAESLQEIDLSYNKLTEVDGAFVAMGNLTKIDLTGNLLTSITEFTFRDVTNLRYLHLSDNRIEQVDRKAFKTLHRLLYLVMKGNPLGDRVHRFHFNSLLLSYVDFSDCGLTKVPKGLSDSIRYLQLRRNNITELTTTSFEDCPYINILVLDENQLGHIEDGTFAKMYHLQQLWLNDNQLKALPAQLPASLRRLLADNNKLRRVDNVFNERSQLSMISLVHNEIKVISKDALTNLEALQTLDLSNNKISKLDGELFVKNSELKTLLFNKNPLSQFSSKTFWGLESLRSLSLGYLSSSGGENGDGGMKEFAMPEDLFEPLSKLSRLELDNSPRLVKALLASDKALGSLRPVEELSMTGSDLTTLRSNFRQFLPFLASLRISSVRWHCDKSLIWFRDFLLTSGIKIERKDDITCFTPPPLYGRPIISLTDDLFVDVTTTTTVMTPSPEYKKITTKATTAVPSKNTPPDEGEGDFEGNGWLEYEVLQPVRIDKGQVASDYYDGVIYDDEKQRVKELESDNDNDNKGVKEDADTDVELVWDIDKAADIDEKPESRPTTTQKILVEPSYERTTEQELDYFRTRVIIAVVTVVITCFVAAIIIALIIYVWNRNRRQNNPEFMSASLERTIIKYKNKNGVLYFSTSGSIDDKGVQSSAQSLLPALPATPGSNVTSSSSLPEVHQTTPPPKYYKTRVYKWEDF